MTREIPAKREDGKCSVCVIKKAVTREGFCKPCLRRRLYESDFRWAPGMGSRPRGTEKRQAMNSDGPKRSDLKRF